jgi:AGCS family alanine or glycine:cation symporter
LIELILRGAETVDKLLWGPWTMVFIAAVSVYLTVRSGFFQIRGFFFILRETLGRLFEKGSERDRSSGCGSSPFSG